MRAFWRPLDYLVSRAGEARQLKVVQHFLDKFGLVCVAAQGKTAKTPTRGVYPCRFAHRFHATATAESRTVPAFFLQQFLERSRDPKDFLTAFFARSARLFFIATLQVFHCSLNARANGQPPFEVFSLQFLYYLVKF